MSGAPAGKRIILFVDDLNMPKLDTYGSQPPIELLRQYQDFGGLYDREKLFWKEINVRLMHGVSHDLENGWVSTNPQGGPPLPYLFPSLLLSSS